MPSEENGQKAGVKIQGELIFDHVSLERDGHQILREINLTLPAGKTLGIMGMTGSGKTTMVNLLQRFYDVSSGRILLDGADIRSIPLARLRSSVAVVSQDVFLFSDTVSQNIKTGQKAEMKDETVVWAIERAGAHKFVSKLSQQYETIVGERGVGLSGGQKQRLSIARAIAKQTPILVLDDATSALDMETEKLLQENLKEVGDMTKIIIGHRISSVCDADEIIVLDQNTIAERGTHEELMALKGRYYQTWCVQYGENRAVIDEREPGNGAEADRGDQTVCLSAHDEMINGSKKEQKNGHNGTKKEFFKNDPEEMNKELSRKAPEEMKKELFGRDPEKIKKEFSRKAPEKMKKKLSRNDQKKNGEEKEGEEWQ